MEDSIFTRIIKGEIPCHKIYEDQRTIAFLDIHPVQPGMTLVVSKHQVVSFLDLQPDDYKALFETIRKVGKRLREVFPSSAQIGVQLEGLDVPHVHAKLFPFSTTEEFNSRADMSLEPDHLALEEIAQKLRF